MRVTVVGAGIVGAAVAFYLSRRGVQVTVIEASQPASGASGHSFAYLNSFGKEPAPYHDLNRRSMDMWDRFARLLESDVGLRWGGKLRWESTDERATELMERVAELQARGYPCRPIDRDEMVELEPGLSPGPVTAAVLSEIDGQVDPPKVVRECLKSAAERGAEIRLETEATGLVVDGGRVRAAQTGGGHIGCDAVVVAAGVGATRLAASAGVHVPQEESPGVVVRTDPRPRLLRTVSVVYAPPIDAGRSEIHLRQTADGSFMFGEGHQESLHRDDSQKHAEELLARAIHYLPALAGATAIPVPVGYRPMPLDGLPVLGFAEAVPNLYIAVMHSGVTLAPLVGEWATMEIVDGARIEALEMYRPERFG